MKNLIISVILITLVGSVGYILEDGLFGAKLYNAFNYLNILHTVELILFFVIYSAVGILLVVSAKRAFSFIVFLVIGILNLIIILCKLYITQKILVSIDTTIVSTAEINMSIFYIYALVIIICALLPGRSNFKSEYL